MRQKHKKISLVVGFILTTFLTIIFSQIGATWAAEEEIKMGAVYSMTGGGAQWGERFRAGNLLAIEEENAKGGVNGKKLKLIVCDSKTVVKDGVACGNQMIHVHHVPVFFGVMSGIVNALLPIANENKTVFVNPGAYHPAIRKGGPYVFSVMHLADDDCKVQADFIRKVLKLKRGAIMYINSGFGVVMAETIKREWEAIGGETLSYETHQPDSTDFRTQLTKLKALKPEVVFLESMYTEMALIIKQASELGITGVRWMSFGGIHAPQAMSIMGDASEGVLCATAGWDPNDPREMVQNYKKNLKEKYGHDAEIYGAMAYDSIRILAHVMRKYGITAEDIRKGMREVRNFPGVTGNISFDKDGVAVRKVWVNVCQKGEWAPYKGYEYVKKIE